MPTTRRLLVAVLIAASPALLNAQAAPSAAAPRDTAADRRAVLGVVKSLFDAMRTKDSAAARGLFHPNAQLWNTTMRGGERVVTVEGVDAIVKAIGGPTPDVLDERTRNEIVHLDGALASVWTDYSFYIGTRFSHCGVDAFQMAETKDGWKIIALADTRRRQGCPER